jgi:chemotaxis signal transduction protein
MENTEDSFSSAVPALKSRYLLTHIDDQTFAFPAQWVAEVILVERSQILSLPFYNPLLLGVVHHQGMIVPLIAAHLLLSKKSDQEIRPTLFNETLSVVRLGQQAEHLAGVGLVVEQVVEQAVDDFTTESSTRYNIFQLSDVPSQIWQPQL